MLLRSVTRSYTVLYVASALTIIGFFALVGPIFLSTPTKAAVRSSTIAPVDSSQRMGRALPAAGLIVR